MKKKIVRYIDFTNTIKQIYVSFNKPKELECDLRTLTSQGYKILSIDSQLPEWYFRNLKKYGNVYLCSPKCESKVREYNKDGEIVFEMILEDALDEMRDEGMIIELEEKQDKSIVANLKNWRMYKDV